jgi:predicted nucleotidyltransferase
MSDRDPIERGPRRHDAVIDRFVEHCRADERIVAAFLGGSRARGEADRYSDLDLCAITTDQAYEDVVADRRSIIEEIGEPLFLEDFGLEGVVFFILADDTEAELYLVREGGLHELHDVGVFRTLVDKRGILADARFPWREPDRAEQLEMLHGCVYWFWHELSHFTAAVGRGHLWWAYGQLESLRALVVNLIRIEQGVAAQGEAYEKLDTVVPAARLSALATTFCPMERRAMLRAAVQIADVHRELAPVLASAYDVTYPAELERLMRARLDALVGETS